jgi:biotin transport system substrate-specific component
MKALVQSKRIPLIAEISSILTFTLLMVASAHIRIHLFFTPVPITMQTFVVCMSIVLLRQKASISQMLYMLIGALGLSVFSNGGAGMLYLAGPTGGYIMGFFIAALIFSFVFPREVSFLKLIVLFTGVNVVIYSCGVAWLVGLHHLTFNQAFVVGVAPFIIAEVVKIILAATLSLKVSNRK